MQFEIKALKFGRI